MLMFFYVYLAYSLHEEMYPPCAYRVFLSLLFLSFLCFLFNIFVISFLAFFIFSPFSYSSSLIVPSTYCLLIYNSCFSLFYVHPFFYSSGLKTDQAHLHTNLALSLGLAQVSFLIGMNIAPAKVKKTLLLRVPTCCAISTGREISRPVFT